MCRCRLRTSSSSAPKSTWCRKRYSPSAIPESRFSISTFASRRSKTSSSRSRGATGMSLERIFAVLQQEFYITARSVEVIVDLPFWSLITVVVFGFVTRFLSTVMNPTVAHYLYLGTLMWEIMRVAQYSMSLGVLWNVWSHNFSNMFITPVSMVEYVLAQVISGAVKAVVLFAVVVFIAAFVFDFNMLSMGLGNLTLLFLNLLCFAYS